MHKSSDGKALTIQINLNLIKSNAANRIVGINLKMLGLISSKRLKFYQKFVSLSLRELIVLTIVEWQVPKYVL